jgi:hypothetical protein
MRSPACARRTPRDRHRTCRISGAQSAKLSNSLHRALAGSLHEAAIMQTTSSFIVRDPDHR